MSSNAGGGVGAPGAVSCRYAHFFLLGCLFSLRVQTGTGQKLQDGLNSAAGDLTMLLQRDLMAIC